MLVLVVLLLRERPPAVGCIMGTNHMLPACFNAVRAGQAYSAAAQTEFVGFLVQHLYLNCGTICGNVVYNECLVLLRLECCCQQRLATILLVEGLHM
jgi:hypothetical protein